MTTFTDLETKLKYDIEIKHLNHNKNEYIIRHLKELLPDWKNYPKTIIFLFFECKHPLDGSNLFQEQLEKNRLLLKFNQLGNKFYNLCQKEGILSEIICPKEGIPLYSAKGKQIFSIQSLILRYLPWIHVKFNECGVIHPLWHQAVYPCVMLSSGKTKQIKSIIKQITQNF